jgi:hypothetical protein
LEINGKEVYYLLRRFLATKASNPLDKSIIFLPVSVALNHIIPLPVSGKQLSDDPTPISRIDERLYKISGIVVSDAKKEASSPRHSAKQPKMPI